MIQVDFEIHSKVSIGFSILELLLFNFEVFGNELTLIPKSLGNELNLIPKSLGNERMYCDQSCSK